MQIQTQTSKGEDVPDSLQGHTLSQWLRLLLAMLTIYANLKVYTIPDYL
jgi:hypothetical protein